MFFYFLNLNLLKWQLVHVLTSCALSAAVPQCCLCPSCLISHLLGCHCGRECRGHVIILCFVSLNLSVFASLNFPARQRLSSSGGWELHTGSAGESGRCQLEYDVLTGIFAWSDTAGCAHQQLIIEDIHQSTHCIL